MEFEDMPTWDRVVAILTGGSVCFVFIHAIPAGQFLDWILGGLIFASVLLAGFLFVAGVAGKKVKS